MHAEVSSHAGGTWVGCEHAYSHISGTWASPAKTHIRTQNARAIGPMAARRHSRHTNMRTATCRYDSPLGPPPTAKGAAHTPPWTTAQDAQRGRPTGGPRERHETSGRATPPSGSDRAPTPYTPHHHPNARNPGLAAQTEEQRRQEPGCTHGAKEGAADLQGARSRGARSQIHGRRARKASSISDTRVRCANRHGKRPRIARALLCDVRVAHRVDLGVAMHPSTTQPGAH